MAEKSVPHRLISFRDLRFSRLLHMQTRRMHLDFVGKTYAVIINWLKILTVISLLFTLPFIEFIIRIQYSPCTFPFILHLMEFSLIFNLL